MENKTEINVKNTGVYPVEVIKIFSSFSLKTISENDKLNPGVTKVVGGWPSPEGAERPVDVRLARTEAGRRLVTLRLHRNPQGNLRKGGHGNVDD